jgi:hypothetical protein
LHLTQSLPKPEFLAWLENLPSLREIDLRIPTHHYPILLPKLSTIPLLKKLGCYAVHMQAATRPNISFGDARALRNLITSKNSLEDITLHALHFSNSDGQLVCDGIKESRICCLELTACEFGNDTMMTAALTSLSLQKLEFDTLEMAKAWSIVGPSSPCLLHLEEFKCFFKEDEKLLVDVLQQLTRYPRLKAVALVTNKYSDGTDQALSECVQSCAQLTKINVTFFGILGSG